MNRLLKALAISFAIVGGMVGTVFGVLYLLHLYPIQTFIGVVACVLITFFVAIYYSLPSKRPS